MKTTGQILQTLSSMFRPAENRRKRSQKRGLAATPCAAELLEARTLLTVPLLESNPGAPVTIYLDFDGQDFSRQDVYITQSRFLFRMSPIPAFTIDNNVGPDSIEEEVLIEEIFHRVAEDFRPFTANVTTIAPTPGPSVIHVAIGGNGAVTHNVGGVIRPFLFTSPSFGLQGAFTDRPTNPVLIFPQQLQAIDGVSVARAISKGVGYQLGLTDNPAQGTGDAVPIMGSALAGANRDIWTTRASGANEIQIMTGLGAFINPGFRLRQDDVGNNIFTSAAADNVLVVSPQPQIVPLADSMIHVGANLGQVDSDFFGLTLDFRQSTGTAQINIQINGLSLNEFTFLDGFVYPGLNQGSNLDIVANLYDVNGTLVATSDLANSIDGFIAYEIPSSAIPANRIATYFLEVTTTAEIGSLGVYSVTGSLQEVLGAPVVTAPGPSVTTVLPTFGWTSSLQATRYILQVYNADTGRLVFAKSTGATAYTVNPDDLTVQPAPINSLPQGNYRARVRAIRGAGGPNNESVWGEFADFTIDVPTPARPTVISPKGDIGTSFPAFTWSRGGFDAGYSIIVNRLGTSSSRVINRTFYVGNSYTHFSPLVDGNYNVAVRAFNAANEPSSWSEFVTFTVDSPVPVAPALSAPTGTVTSTNPRFVWNAVAGAARYDLWVNNLSTGTSQFIRQQNLPFDQTFYDPPTLPQGNYTAFIRAINGNGQASPWSARKSFTVNVLPPAAPTMTGPRGANDSSTISTTNPTFTWSSVARAVKYDLLVNNLTTNTAQVIRQRDLTTTSFTSIANLNQGRHRAWVRGINVANEVGDWSAPFDFVIDEPTPNTPIITAPVATSVGFVETANPTFVWSVTPAAPFYDFHLYNSSLRTTVISVKGLTESQYRVPDNKRLGEFTYMARVRSANNSGDTSDWSPWFQIRVNVPNTTTPILISPNGTITDNTPTFTWVHTATSFRYELLLRDLGNGDSRVLQVSSFGLGPGNATAIYTLPDNLALNRGTYRFWVRAFNSQNQASAWSTSMTFVVASLKDSAVPRPQTDVLADALGSEFEADSDAVEIIAASAKMQPEYDTEETVPPRSTAILIAEANLPVNGVEQAERDELEESLIDLVMQRVADPSTGLVSAI